MARGKVVPLLLGILFLALYQPSHQGGVYVPAGTGVGHGGIAGGGAGVVPYPGAGVVPGYKPAKAGGGLGGRGVGGLGAGGLGVGGLGAGAGAKAPKPGYGNLGAGGLGAGAIGAGYKPGGALGRYGGVGVGGYYPGAGVAGGKPPKTGVGAGGLPGVGIQPGTGAVGKAAKPAKGPVIPQTGLPGVGPGGKAAKAAAKVPGVGVPGLYQGGLVPGQGFGGRGVLPGVATGDGLKPKSVPGAGQLGPLGLPVNGYGGPRQPGVFYGYPIKSPKAQGLSGVGKGPYGYGGFGAGAGLAGGAQLGAGSKPGYPTGTGVGIQGLSPAQAKAAKYGNDESHDYSAK